MKLKEKDKEALKEFKSRIKAVFRGARFILFGSKVTGKDCRYSDIDVLILLNRKINTGIEKQIFDIGFEVGLRFEVVFGIVVEENKFWRSPLANVMPFYQNVANQGIAI